MSRLALLHNVRVGDTVTVETYLSTLVFPNIRSIERYTVLDRVVAIDITDETGCTYTADENIAVRIDRPA